MGEAICRLTQGLTWVVCLCFVAIVFPLWPICGAEKEPVDIDEMARKQMGNSTGPVDLGGFRRPEGSLLGRFHGGSDLGFVHAFIASVSVIVVSELGDKTFFIAAIMAMRHSRITVFFGAMSALAVMTILSACLGFATTVIPRAYTYYISTALFALFGLKMLKEGYYMSRNEGQEEFEEVHADLRKRDEEMQKSRDPTNDGGEGGAYTSPQRRRLLAVLSHIFVQAFTLTFLAEWGDRSQLTTIILAAREDIVGVTLGGTLGHAFCTALAVIGGRIVAQRISVRTVTLVGGVVFLVFALSAFFVGPSE